MLLSVESMTHAGVYIHVPFCRSRCSYCDFATGLYHSELAERYVSAVGDEIATSANAGGDVDTIYFGGGTPSLLTPGQLDRILSAVHRQFRVANDSEVTLEINPGTVTGDQLRA